MLYLVIKTYFEILDINNKIKHSYRNTFDSTIDNLNIIENIKYSINAISGNGIKKDLHGDIYYGDIYHNNRTGTLVSHGHGKMIFPDGTTY